MLDCIDRLFFIKILKKITLILMSLPGLSALL